MSTIAGHVRRNAQRVPEREALVADGRIWTWAQLDADADRIAAVLAARGVTPGDRVAVMAPNGAGFARAYYGVLRAGAVLVPVNSRLAPPEVDHILGDAGAAAFLLGPGEPADGWLAARAVDVSVLGLGLASGADGVEDLLALADAVADAPAVDHGDESSDALILYTSGTTGRPKGVLMDHRRAVWTGLSEVATCGLVDGERYLHIAPMYHSGGITFLTVTTLLSGTNVVLPAFEPGAVLEAIETHRCSVFLGVPTMFGFLLRHPDLHARDLSSWRIGIFGAAPMPPSTLADMLRELPQVKLIHQLGQTEAGPTGIYADDAQVRRRPEVTGWQAMSFCSARVVGEDGADVAPGETGELLLAGEGIMKGYWNQPEATAEVLRDGWLHTGDVVRLDADGGMTIVDRLKDVIITGGRNVYSVEVERILDRHPDIADCAVVGRPHADYGESIVAVVTPAEGASVDLAAVRAFCRGELADYKLPHDLVVAVVPRNAAGKALKHELRALVAGPASPAPIS